jgi:hypothetical protein
MQLKGKAALAIDYDALTVYFTIASYNDGTGETGPILVGKFVDLS